MKFGIGNLKGEFGPIFWLHLLVIILVWTSPFWLPWPAILLFIIIYYFQIWLLGGCIFTQAQFKHVSHDHSFYYHYLRKLGLRPDKRKLHVFLNYIAPWIILMSAYLYQ